MKLSLRFVCVALVIAALGFVFSTQVVSTHAAGQATVTTDKTKYGVGETMIISGTGFSANAPSA
jgi:phosphoribosylcarboxyaminoimidazole (NCAIR) mutase